MDGRRGTTTGPISRSGPSCAFVCLLSIGGNGDIDHSEPDDELPGEFSLQSRAEEKKKKKQTVISEKNQIDFEIVRTIFCKLVAVCVRKFHAAMIVSQCMCWHGSLVDTMNTIHVILREAQHFQFR